MEPTNHVKYLGLYLMDCNMEPTNHVKYLGLYLMETH